MYCSFIDQIMVVTAPVVVFHFLVTYFAKERDNIKETEAARASSDNGATQVRMFSNLFVLEFC